MRGFELERMPSGYYLGYYLLLYGTNSNLDEDISQSESGRNRVIIIKWCIRYKMHALGYHIILGYHDHHDPRDDETEGRGREGEGVDHVSCDANCVSSLARS